MQTSNTQDFTEKYILPYIIPGDILSTTPTATHIREHQSLELSNGSGWRLTLIHSYTNEGDRDLHSDFVEVMVDINGYQSKPNEIGRDQFQFYITPDMDLKNLHALGAGDGAIIKNSIIKAGLHYDGEGFTDTELRTNQYRGCQKRPKGQSYPTQAFCTGIIAQNGWKIPDDYPIKL